jgi:hypothetical protein
MRLFSPLLLCLLAASAAFAQRGFRIQGEVIQLGDSKFNVLSQLGQPYGQNSYEVEFLFGRDPLIADRKFVQYEFWFYNFGANQFTTTLCFVNGRLDSVQEGERGFNRPDFENCSPLRMRVERGDMFPKVLMICGEPSFIDRRRREDYQDLGEGKAKRTWIIVEEWTYNFGPDHPLATLIFENGFLVRIQTEERGF